MDFTDFEEEIIIGFADCNMNTAELSRKLYRHRNTVTYHMEKIKKKTGLDPAKFYDLVKLVEAVNNNMQKPGA